MAGPAVDPSVEEQLKQLNNARKLVLGDVTYYPQIVQSVLPILGVSRDVHLRRWGADFLAEVFASPALPSREKETLSLLVLETLKTLVLEPDEDIYILRNAIQTAASIYPLAMRWVINNSYDQPTWERMSAIKASILGLWDGAPTTIRISCIKFAQRVVLAQTVANTERIRGETLNVSLSMIPPNHPLLDPRNLEAEATGLLDRMLGVLQENSCDALIIDATLNCLSVLVRTRPGTANRILNAVLSFNPLKLANSPMTPKTRVLIKSMEKTTRMFLIHLTKRDPHNPLAGRIQQHVERLMRSRADIFDDASRKRAYIDPNGQDAVKRQKLMAAQAQAQAAPQLEMAPLAPGPHSLAEVFTLAKDKGLAKFDVTQVPLPYAVKISVTALSRMDAKLLERARDCILGRLDELARASSEINPATAPLGVEDDDDDDYDPDFYAAEDTEQILNKLDSSPPESSVVKGVETSLGLGSFTLPPPPTLTPETAAKVGRGTVTRVFSMVKTLDESAGKKPKSGIGRLAASSLDRESWLTVITRLATRSSAGLDDISVKAEDGGNYSSQSLSDGIREILYAHVMEDFRRRIEICVSWLCEEWYNDQLYKRAGRDVPMHYDKWVLKMMDGFLAFLNPTDKILTRFLSEIPEINVAILSRVKRLCRDPAMVQLVLTSLHYLLMFRPPVKELALDTLQEIWSEFEDARPMAAKLLQKYRSEFLLAAEQIQSAGMAPGHP